MKHTLSASSIAIIAVAMSVSAALADPLPTFDTTAGAGYRPTLPVAAITLETGDQIRAANEHARETWDAARDAGGCNADFLPYEIAAGCFNLATGNNPDAPIGASRGGD